MGCSSARSAFLVSLLLGSSGLAAAFSKGDVIKVVASHVGPVNNPSETYGYYVLPFCSPKSASSVDQDLGESLTGDRKEETPYELIFGKDEEFKELCSKVRGVVWRRGGVRTLCARQGGMGWGRLSAFGRARFPPPTLSV